MVDARTDPQYKLRIPIALKNKIFTIARENSRSINQEIILRLEQAYGDKSDYARENTGFSQQISIIKQELNSVIMHVLRSYRPESWGNPKKSVYPQVRDESFTALRRYADEELGAGVSLTDALWVCAEKWLEHVGQLPPKSAEAKDDGEHSSG